MISHVWVTLITLKQPGAITMWAVMYGWLDLCNKILRHDKIGLAYMQCAGNNIVDVRKQRKPLFLSIHGAYCSLIDVA